MKRLAFTVFSLAIATACAHADTPAAPVAPRAPAAPAAPATPATPAAPVAPAAPAAPVAPKAHHGYDSLVDLDSVNETIEHELGKAFEQLDASLAQIKDLPPPMRGKLEGRIAHLRATMQHRMEHLNGKDLDRLGEEVGRMGEEIGKLGEEIGNEVAQEVEKQAERHAGRGAGGAHIDVHFDRNDADDEMGDGPDVDDDDDVGEEAHELGDLKLAPDQHEKLVKLRADSDRRIAAAKDTLRAAAKKLHEQIEHDACDDDISKSIDAVSRQEAEIRKARVLAWTGARRLLDDAQRKRIEAAAAKRTK